MDEQGELYPWFHGLITRREAENFLLDEEPGTFLVRVSEKANGYALSFKFGERPRHYKIELALGVRMQYGCDDGCRHVVCYRVVMLSWAARSGSLLFKNWSSTTTPMTCRTIMTAYDAGVFFRLSVSRTHEGGWHF
jgi:hypothetical protein